MAELLLVKCSYCTQYKAKYEPRNGCTGCWDKYFLTHIATSALMLRQTGLDLAVAVSLFGEKKVKQFQRFIKERDDRNGRTNNS